MGQSVRLNFADRQVPYGDRSMTGTGTGTGTGKRCAFCGEPMRKVAGTKRTKEHGLPLWTASYITDQGGEYGP